MDDQEFEVDEFAVDSEERAGIGKVSSDRQAGDALIEARECDRARRPGKPRNHTYSVLHMEQIVALRKPRDGAGNEKS